LYSFLLITIFVILVVIKPTRKIALSLTPWLIFACSYDWMRLMPNYQVNSIDVANLYNTEKSIFGITTTSGVLIPGEYFALHNCEFVDILAGLFYLCWVPVPLAFSIYLYFKGERRYSVIFSMLFLFVNLIGFCGYYIYPAAPPWYAINYGFTPVINTPGNVAGLGRFDNITGIPIFHAIYGKNANVFAAVPSLHAAYLLITTYFAIISHRSKSMIITFAIICLGIWFTAVYTEHHYIIDVLLGIATATIGILIFFGVIMKTRFFKHFLDKYTQVIN
jgi:hypothetical protein